VFIPTIGYIYKKKSEVIKMRKLLAPIDSAEMPEKLKTYLKDLVSGLDYEVTLLYVIPVERVYAHAGLITLHEEKLPIRESIAKEILEKAESNLRALGIEKIQVKQTSGDPAEEILKMAGSDDFHLIVMCTHGMSVTKRLLIGSVTNKVVHHAEIPVMTVR
jgi:nucleotide-binding universal stress UspA family protein